jgi:hypothetical protein
MQAFLFLLFYYWPTTEMNVYSRELSIGKKPIEEKTREKEERERERNGEGKVFTYI